MWFLLLFFCAEINEQPRVKLTNIVVPGLYEVCAGAESLLTLEPADVRPSSLEMSLPSVPVTAQTAEIQWEENMNPPFAKLQVTGCWISRAAHDEHSVYLSVTGACEEEREGGGEEERERERERCCLSLATLQVGHWNTLRNTTNPVLGFKMIFFF